MPGTGNLSNYPMQVIYLRGEFTNAIFLDQHEFQQHSKTYAYARR